MRGTGLTFSRLPAARAFFAGAAILAGTMVSAALAQPAGSGNGDETAMAVPLMVLPGGSGGVALPRPLSPSDVARVRRVFVAQSDGDLRVAVRETDALDNKLLLGSILADRYLGRFHVSTAAELTDWLQRFGSQPEASAIYTLLLRKLPRGVTAPPAPQIVAMSSTYSAATPQHVDDEDDTDKLPIARNVLLDHRVLSLAQSRNDAAAVRLIETSKNLAPAYRALLQADVAQVLFTQNRDARALDIARQALDAPPPDQRVALAGLIAGFAAWRLHRPQLAAGYFEAAADAPVASLSQHAEAAFWAARAARQTGDPLAAAYWLHQAARQPRTFDGLIARRALRMSAGIDTDRDTLSQPDIDAISELPAGERAFALLQVGQPELAEAELRTLWPKAKADPAFARALRLVASSTGLVNLAAQLIAETEATDGSQPMQADLPLPPLHPAGGFQVDPSLVYALTRLESDFDNGAVSPKGARGLMQIMPETARFIAGNPSLGGDRLHDPAINLALGQKYVRYLAMQDNVDGDLIRMLASYNAGPGSFARWSGSVRDDGDPLLFIEAIPNPETRAFVRRALTYAWIYAARFGRPAPGLDALVAGEFPRFTRVAQSSTLPAPAPRFH